VVGIQNWVVLVPIIINGERKKERKKKMDIAVNETLFC